MTPVSFKGRHRRVYEDEEDDLDSLLSSVRKTDNQDVNDQGEDEVSDGEGVEDGGRRRTKRAGGTERNEESFGTARRRRPGKVISEEKAVSERRVESEASESEDEMDNFDNEKKGDKREKRGRVPKGEAITAQETVRLGNVSMKGRRKHVIEDEEEDIDAVLAGVSSTYEVERKPWEAREVREVKEGGGEKASTGKRVPRGERITAPTQQSLGTLSFKERRRRKIEDEVRVV